MVNFKYLYAGLCGLAQAHRANSMAGHLGAAVATGYFFGEDQADLPDPVVTAIERELDRIMGGDESIWFNPEQEGVTIPELFAPVNLDDLQEDRIGELAEALSENIDELRQSGHNVIFTSIAIRGLRDHPRYASSAMIDGILKLVRSFDGAGPGRGYYGAERGWIIGDVELPADDPLPPYADEISMANAVIDELIQTGAIHRSGYGGLFHLINHATALTELSRFGFRELANRGLKAHYHHLRLYRALPDVSAEMGVLQAAKADPLTAEYWQQADSTQWSAHLTHRVKTLYGFYNLLRFIEDADKRTQAKEMFRYLMA